MPTLIPTSEDVRVYELCIMYAPDINPKDESQLIKNIETLFHDAGGKQLFKDPWSRRGLAYKIKGYEEAKFIIIYYELDPAKIREIDATMRLEKDIVRHLIAIPPKGYEAVSYEDRYKEWIDTRETAADMRAREKEEKLKAQVQAKAKMEAKRLDAQKKKQAAEVKEPAIESEKLTEELEKLISDEDLDL